MSTVLAYVLRKYGFDGFASMFEKDRTEYEIRSEVGRRPINQGRGRISPIDSIMNEYITQKFGESRHLMVLARLREHGC